MSEQEHARNGNCWMPYATGDEGDVCAEHNEPRGECDQCVRCKACDEHPSKS